MKLTETDLDPGFDAGPLLGLLSHMSEVALFYPVAIYVAMLAFAAFVAIATNKKARREAAIEVLRTLLGHRRRR